MSVTVVSIPVTRTTVQTEEQTVAVTEYVDSVTVTNVAQRGLKGETGDDGLSAYQVALENGFSGTEAEWLESLVGPPGENGEVGDVAISDIDGLQAALDAKANSSHTHDYAATSHNHDGTYSPVAHNHSGVYSPVSHDHASEYSPVAHNHDAAYAALAHNHAGVYEPANANIQAHISSSHAPSDAQKNSDITKEEIESKLTGEISSHSHSSIAFSQVMARGLGC